MVFVCPSKNETETRLKMLSELKCLVGKIEDKLAVTAEPTYCITQTCVPQCCSPCSPMSSLCCAPCCVPCCTPQKEEVECEPPETMICYKVCSGKKQSKNKKNKSPDSEVIHRVKNSSSRELRASVLYTGCDCERRFGLQDDCRRSDCLGSPACLTKPNPTCGPSEYANGKHLEMKFGSSVDKKGGNKNIDSENVEAGEDPTYVCYPARIKPPNCCVPTCFVAMDCLAMDTK